MERTFLSVTLSSHQVLRVTKNRHKAASSAVSTHGQNKSEEKEREKSNSQAEKTNAFAWFLGANQNFFYTLSFSKDLLKIHCEDCQLYQLWLKAIAHNRNVKKTQLYINQTQELWPSYFQPKEWRDLLTTKLEKPKGECGVFKNAFDKHL